MLLAGIVTVTVNEGLPPTIGSEQYRDWLVWPPRGSAGVIVAAEVTSLAISTSEKTWIGMPPLRQKAVMLELFGSVTDGIATLIVTVAGELVLFRRTSFQK